MSKRNKKVGLSPEAAEVFAEANAINNGTSVEEEKALNQAAMDRDNKKPSIWKEIVGDVMKNGGGTGTLEIDYSLPYNEAKKKYGHNGHFMSEDQYEQIRAKFGIKPQVASPEASNGMVVNGVDYSQPYEASLAKHLEKNGSGAPFASKEDYEAAKARIYNQGTSPDVDDTKAIGATKEELYDMLQNGQISKDAYDKQIAALDTPEVQEAMDAGTKKADETVWDSTNRDKTTTEVTTPNVKESKNRYNKSMMSIWDAYRNGEFGLDENGEPSKDAKARAMYYTIDAIATLAKNLGRSVGNVGAQFSGGTIDNGHDDSKWEQRQNKLFDTELQAESEEIKTFDNILKSYQLDKAKTVNDMLNDFNAKANDRSLPVSERRIYQVLAAQLAGAGLDRNTQVASVAGGVWDDIKSKFGEWFGKKDK